MRGCPPQRLYCTSTSGPIHCIGDGQIVYFVGNHLRLGSDMPIFGSMMTISPPPMLDAAQLQEALGVKPGTKFEGCSGRVAQALGPDVMQSVKHLVPDLLAALPVLLYQGVSGWHTYSVACSDHQLTCLHAAAMRLLLGKHDMHPACMLVMVQCTSGEVISENF